MATPRVLILRSPGANCDAEAQFAFERAGALAERVHVNRLREDPKLLHRFQILVVPGGFTYGDDVAAGKILGNQLSVFLADALREFRDAEKLILGICNRRGKWCCGMLVPTEGRPSTPRTRAVRRGTLLDCATLAAGCWASCRIPSGTSCRRSTRGGRDRAWPKRGTG